MGWVKLIDEKSMGDFKYPAPISSSGGCDLYECALNPLSWIDPLGASSVSFSGWKLVGG